MTPDLLKRPQAQPSKLFFIVARLLLALLFVLPAASTAQAAGAAAAALPCVEVIVNPVTAALDTLRGCRSDLNPALSPADAAQAFLVQHHQAFGMPAGLGDLQLVQTAYGLKSSHVLFQQLYAGRPVVDATVGVHFDQHGHIQALYNRYRSGLTANVGEAAVSAERAVQIARDAIAFVSARGDSPPAQQMILPQADGRGRLVWRVLVLAAQPQGDWEVLIDAATGAVLKRFNRLILNHAQVFLPNPAQQSGRSDTSGAAWTELQSVALQGLDGSGWLRGEFVDLTSPVGHVPASAYAPDGNFVYMPSDPRFEEVMVYYHIDATQRYLESLGFSDRNTPPNGIRNRVMRASAHWFAEDQSFYSISDDALHFGDGGLQDAEDADIIVHEYGHALHHDQLACWGGGDMEAIGEGFSDYLAASRFADVGDDPACIAEWDSRGYLAEPPFCLRRVDDDGQYPLDVTGDAHADGELWSRVLWDVRSALGARAADTLALETNFYLPCGATLPDAAQALLDADASAFGGAHRALLEPILMARGLLPLAAPTDLSPAEAMRLTPGSAVTVDWASALPDTAVYEVQFSANAHVQGELREGFDADRWPDAFSSFGNRPWQVASGAAQAGAVDHGQSSSLAMAIDVAEGSTLHFTYRVSSEATWDGLQVLVDGEIALDASGETGWKAATFPLTAGAHTVIWRYHKDKTISAGQDSAWIDNVVVSQASLATWQPIDLAVPADSGSHSVVWRVPDAVTSSVKLRVRARLGEVTSSWTVGPATFLIGEPTAVRLSSLEAQNSDAVGPAMEPIWETLTLGAVVLGGLLIRRAASRKRL